MAGGLWKRNHDRRLGSSAAGIASLRLVRALGGSLNVMGAAMTTANARARRRGKDHERRLAKATGGKRSGNLGRAAADVTAGWLCIEGKAWTTPPKRVEAALEQAERAASADQLPIAVIHTTGRRSSNDLVVMRWGQFVDWFGRE